MRQKRRVKPAGYVVIALIIVLLGFLLYINSRFYYYRPIYLSPLRGLRSYDVVMTRGSEYRLYILALNERVSYSSSDFKVATVNIHGKITAWRCGTTVISVRFKDKTLKCRVTVVALNKQKLRLKEGGFYNLNVSGAEGIVRWKTSNKKVATVNRFGIVVAKGKGTATITATYHGKKMRCKVIVK